MKLAQQPAALLLLLLVAPRLCVAQFRSARQADRNAAPNWEINEHFKKDVFTFVRIKYISQEGGYWRRGGWQTDFPDSDLNFSFRLQQMTSLRVDPDGKILEISDPELFDYPWIYIVEPGRLKFTEEEVPILRRYLLSGGFLMVDDFWGEREWRNFYDEIKRVFPEPEREPRDLEMNHPIFHCVFDIKETKNKLQVPNIYLGIQSQYTGVTWERPDATEVHFRAIYDDKGRMMVMICHNTDNGDGWEREGESEYYFHEFSEKKAYPLGINIVFYAMTH
jgi:Domain of unknown function (DUF4159)